MLSAVPALPTSVGDGSIRSFGMLSTFPPTLCGIATFSAALASGLIAEGYSVDVVRCDASPPVEDPMVLASLADTAPAGRVDAVALLNANDVVIVQHEYGLFDGRDGREVLALMAALDVPIVVVAHTVLSEPTPNQWFTLHQVCAAADAVVVMTETARGRLVARYGVDDAKVTLIPHGATTPLPARDACRRTHSGPPRLLTWGLLGPGKGIEWAIDALPALDDLRPRPEYVIAGATHPKVRQHQGEAYRDMLVERVARSGSAVRVSFDDTYRDLASLTELIQTADVVVLPYDSRDQVTSGVLVDAVAGGRPVVSTQFPHAVELLGTGAGIVVPQRDPRALGAAIRSVLTDPARAASMAAEARRLAPGLGWAAVARRYADLSDGLVPARRAVPR